MASKKKIGRPRKRKTLVIRISASISEEAMKIVKKVPSGKRSEFINLAILNFRDMAEIFK